MAKQQHSRFTRFTRRWKRAFATGVVGSAFIFPLEGCNLGEFTATSTVTSTIVRDAVLTPVETVIDTGIDRLFDWLEGIGDDEG